MRPTSGKSFRPPQKATIACLSMRYKPKVGFAPRLRVDRNIVLGGLRLSECGLVCNAAGTAWSALGMWIDRRFPNSVFMDINVLILGIVLAVGNRLAMIANRAGRSQMSRSFVSEFLAWQHFSLTFHLLIALLGRLVLGLCFSPSMAHSAPIYLAPPIRLLMLGAGGKVAISSSCFLFCGRRQWQRVAAALLVCTRPLSADPPLAPHSFQQSLTFSCDD